MIRTIDLNADVGEGFPWEPELLSMVSSANVCCGAHANDESGIRQTLSEANSRGVVIGAHPSFLDRANFGRREQKEEISTAEITRLVHSQLSDLQALGANINFVKPHGALYNQAQRDRSIALGIAVAASAFEIPILGQPESELAIACKEFGLTFIAEGFIDRRYRPDGRLVSRNEPNSVLEDPAEISDQILRLVEQGIQTLCLHGDNPNSVALGHLVRGIMANAGVEIRPFVGP